MAVKKTTMIRVEQDVYDAIALLAKEKGVSVTKIANAILRKELTEVMEWMKNEK